MRGSAPTPRRARQLRAARAPPPGPGGRGSFAPRGLRPQAPGGRGRFAPQGLWPQAPVGAVALRRGALAAGAGGVRWLRAGEAPAPGLGGWGSFALRGCVPGGCAAASRRGALALAPARWGSFAPRGSGPRPGEVGRLRAVGFRTRSGGWGGVALGGFAPWGLSSAPAGLGGVRQPCLGRGRAGSAAPRGLWPQAPVGAVALRRGALAAGAGGVRRLRAAGRAQSGGGGGSPPVSSEFRGGVGWGNGKARHRFGCRALEGGVTPCGGGTSGRGPRP